MRPTPANDEQWREAQELRKDVLEDDDDGRCIECHVEIRRANVGRWSGLWCDDCDERRVKRITAQLEAIVFDGYPKD